MSPEARTRCLGCPVLVWTLWSFNSRGTFGLQFYPLLEIRAGELDGVGGYFMTVIKWS